MRHLLSLVTILILAAGLRLYGLADAQYRNDDETMFALALRALDAHDVPVRGMHSSLVVANGPTALYMLMVPVALFGTELSATAFMASANVIAVALSWVVVRRHFGPRVALLSALLLATNPWAVVYSRRMWLNAALPLCTMLFFWALLALVRHARAADEDAAPATMRPGARQQGIGARTGSLVLGPVSVRRRWLLLVAILLLAGGAPADSLASAGMLRASGRTGVARLSATPNPVPAGSGMSATTIRWDTGDGSAGQIYVSEDGGPARPFSRGVKGRAAAPWIRRDASYEFLLYAGTNPATPLGSVMVVGSAVRARPVGFAWLAAMVVLLLATRGSGLIRATWLRPVAVGLALSALVQVHLSAIAHAYTALVGLALIRAWRKPLVVLLVGAAFGLSFAPYFLLAFLPDLGWLLDHLATEQATGGGGVPVAVADPERVRGFLYLLTSRGYQTYASQGGRILDTTRGLFLVADTLVVAAFVLGVAVAAVRSMRGHAAERGACVILLAWVASPVLLPAPAARVVGFQHIYPLYFLVALPGALVLVALGLERAGALLRRLYRGLGVVPALTVDGVAALHVIAAGVFFSVQHEYWVAADYGLPLRQTLALVELASTRAGAALILVTGQQEVAEVVYRSLQHHGAPASYVADADLIPLSHADVAVYVTTDDAAWSTRHLLSSFPSREEATLIVPGSDWTARVFRLDTVALADSLDAPSHTGEVGRLDELVAVETARVAGEARPGAPIEGYVRWRFVREPQEPYLTRLDLIDGAGRSVSSREDAFYPTNNWRAGDGGTLLGIRFFQRIVVPLPYETPPGLYTLTLRLVTSGGRPSPDDAVPLGTIWVRER